MTSGDLKSFLSMIAVSILAALVFTCTVSATQPMSDLVATQMQFGPRTPGSDAHTAFIVWAKEILMRSGWEVSEQRAEYKGNPIRNLIAVRTADADIAPWVLVGAHYDSRLYADRDPDPTQRSSPVPGANDGASGVAVLLHLAQTLPENNTKTIWLVLFDAEDQGSIEPWNHFCLGSQLLANRFAKSEAKPDSVLILDMIGDKNLNIRREMNSNQALLDELFSIAHQKGFVEQFINQPGYSIYDDHIPFLEIGIPSADLIDFDYPAWHTVSDTVDQLSESSLNTVYETVYEWLTRSL